MKNTAPNTEEAREFQNAVDHRLSGRKEDPFLARRIIAKEQEEKKVKKKMTLGFALALSLLLIVSAALFTIRGRLPPVRFAAEKTAEKF